MFKNTITKIIRTITNNPAGTVKIPVTTPSGGNAAAAKALQSQVAARTAARNAAAQRVAINHRNKITPITSAGTLNGTDYIVIGVVLLVIILLFSGKS